MLLAGTCTLGGSANVNAGLLQVNGLLTLLNVYVNNAAQLAGSGTISISGGDGLIYGSNAASTFGGTLAGASPLEVASGTLTLGGANTYQGGTLVDPANALLRMGATNALPYGPGQGNVSVSSPGVLDLASFSTNVNGLTGNGTVDNLTAGNATLTVGNNNATSTFSGLIQNTAGSLALHKTGTGMLTLTGSNPYAGGTTMNAGTLVVADGNNFSNAVSALGSGVLTLNGGTLVAGPAGGSVAGMVQAGSGPHTIAPGAGLPAGQFGALNLNGGLSTNANTTLAFNLARTAFRRNL